MTDFKGTFIVRSKTTTTKEKEDEVEKKYSTFAMDDDPESKLRITFHSDRPIDMKANDVVTITVKKSQTNLK